MTNSTESTENNQTKYFDLHTQGVGYVNRVREVPVKRGEPFWACNISALHGSTDAVEYTNFDCRVSGADAIKVIKRLDKASQEEKKILMGFKIGDLYPETFVFKNGQKAGQTGVSLKARLLYIGWVKIDGDSVYTAPSTDNKQDEVDQAVPDTHESETALQAPKSDLSELL